MRPIATDGVVWSVCVLVMSHDISLAKMDELIEIP